MAIDETTFTSVADATLDRLMERIEASLGDHLDVDLEAGILTIELDDGGQYVINKNAPNCQIWMSSPKSGASHYDYDDKTGAWVSTRGGALLGEVLAGELSQAAGRTVDLG